MRGYPLFYVGPKTRPSSTEEELYDKHFTGVKWTIEDTGGERTFRQEVGVT